MSTSRSTIRLPATSKGRKFLLVIFALALSGLAWKAVRTLQGLMMLGYVDSAIVRVRAVVAAEANFVKAHPELGYTCTLSQLPQDGLIARLAKGGIDNGYAFEIVGCEPPNHQSPNSIYHVTARPLHSGLPAFCSDPSGVVRTDDTGSVEKCLITGVALGR
jgi:Na+-transporting NADH:ubiquinone oxidoreductase subunit NqrB